jgi:hypothetical protein
MAMEFITEINVRYFLRKILSVTAAKYDDSSAEITTHNRINLINMGTDRAA